MDYWARKQALKHGEIREIANLIGVSEQLVGAVIAGRRKNRRVRVAIARRIGKPVDEVFPESTEAQQVA